jgi:hypothetical protein
MNTPLLLPASIAQDKDFPMAPEVVVDKPADDTGPTEHSYAISTEKLSPYFTILAAAFGLISDGYQNHLMTMSNVGSIPWRFKIQNIWLTACTGRLYATLSNGLYIISLNTSV